MNIEQGDVWLLMLERYNVNEIAEAAGVSRQTALGLMNRASMIPVTSDQRPGKSVPVSSKSTASFADAARDFGHREMVGKWVYG